MLFALICTDKPDHLQVRLDTRPDHMAFLTGLGDTLKAAGPFLGDDGKPVGSLVIISADDMPRQGCFHPLKSSRGTGYSKIQRQRKWLIG